MSAATPVTAVLAPPQAAAVGPRVCTGCGHVNPAGADQCRNRRCRRTLPGNRLGYRHGLDAAEPDAVLAVMRSEFLAGSLADDGGADEVPTRRRALHEYRARLHVNICAVADALEARGLFDKKGKLRVLWLQRLEGLITTAHRLDATLGLDRRAKRIDPARQLSGLEG